MTCDRDESTYDLLVQIVAETRCKPGWSFRIREGEGALRLVIVVPGVDSWDESKERTVSHWFPVPPATYNKKSWQRWIFECCRGVENHELGEWFRVGDSRPFLPLHGPGENPYVVVEYRDEADALTTQDGSIRDDGPRP
jgi:hypothetical protein